jgi:hypothetical protein
MLHEHAQAAKFAAFFAVPVFVLWIAFGAGAVIAWVALVFAGVIGRVAVRRWQVSRSLRSR